MNAPFMQIGIIWGYPLVNLFAMGGAAWLYYRKDQLDKFVTQSIYWYDSYVALLGGIVFLINPASVHWKLWLYAPIAKDGYLCLGVAVAVIFF